MLPIRLLDSALAGLQGILVILVVFLLAKPRSLAAAADAGRITTQFGTPRGRYDEHSSKSSLSKKPRFIEPVGKN
jgi:hypothetical protein